LMETLGSSCDFETADNRKTPHKLYYTNKPKRLKKDLVDSQLENDAKRRPKS
jgi:hypothetical protein